MFDQEVRKRLEVLGSQLEMLGSDDVVGLQSIRKEMVLLEGRQAGSEAPKSSCICNHLLHKHRRAIQDAKNIQHHKCTC